MMPNDTIPATMSAAPLVLLRRRAVEPRTGLSRSSLFRRVADGLFVPPIRIGPNSSAWAEHEVEAVNRARLAGADNDTIRQLVKDLIAARKATA